MKARNIINRSIFTAAALIGAMLSCAVPALAADAPPRPLAPATALSLREARVIIDGAVGYARDKKLTMTVVILDEEGQLISADRMEGASFHLENLPRAKPWRR